LPDGNTTGVTFYSGELNAKQIELLSQIAPKCSDVGYLVNPKAASAQRQTDIALAASIQSGPEISTQRHSIDCTTIDMGDGDSAPHCD
jgi:ABC-type uncharacterized transport system substrate-binding protein